MDNYTAFIQNPYSAEANLQLGEQYYQEGHTAGALSYFLRCAEYGEDSDLIYEGLIKVALCLKDVQVRPHSTRGAFLNAIMHDPERPEAYYHLSYDHQEKKEWQEAYLAAIQGLLRIKNQKQTKTNIDFPGEHALIFQKAVAAWWIGRCDEARTLFRDLLQYWALGDMFTDACRRDLSNIGGDWEFRLMYTAELHSNLRRKFKNSEKIKVNYAQTLQDMFVLAMLDGKENGTYLEIGSADPFDGNNTALLEKNYNWTGLSLDNDPEEVVKFNAARRNKCILQDATKANFTSLIQEYNLGDTIDYLQLDAEPAGETFNILLRIPFSKYKFAVITYEHDYYVDRTLNYRTASREYLKSLGYVMVAGDIAPDMNSNYEDWWAHPDLIKPETLQAMLDTAEGTKKANRYLMKDVV